MGQKLYKFKAVTLNEAYKRMRKRLGKDAVVLDTTEMTEGGVLGFLGQKMVQLTAAAAPAPAAPPAPTPRKLSAVERKYLGSASAKSDEPVSDTVAYFRQLVRDAQHRIDQAKGAPAPSPARPANAVLPFPQSAPMAAPDTPDPIEEMRQGVDEMRETLQVLVAETAGTGPCAEFAEHYRWLVAQGVSRRTAATLVANVVSGSNLDSIRNPRLFRERMKFQVRKRVAVTGGIALTPGVRRTVALVGATGVGKTTNLAKLAAAFAVRERIRVALVTSDTYRIAAPEQLRVYADIIGLPMEVVNDPGEMAAAMQTFRDHDLILIDTAGGSQFNLEQIQELKATLAPARPDEVLLLLSANTQLHELHNAVENFRCLQPTSVFFTKLDETRQYGSLFSLYMESDLPVSYLSVGQDVPNDIELANPGKIANLIVESGENRDRPSSKSA